MAEHKGIRREFVCAVFGIVSEGRLKAYPAQAPRPGGLHALSRAGHLPVESMFGQSHAHLTASWREPTVEGVSQPRRPESGDMSGD
jgi:hypothetical protein